MKSNKQICPQCKNDKVIFYKGLCRKCYNLEVKKNRNYISVYNGTNENVVKIINLFINYNINKLDISKKLNVTYRYVCYVIKKYAIEVE